MKIRIEVEISEKTLDALYKRELKFRQKLNSVPGISGKSSLSKSDILRAIENDLTASAEWRAQELAGER